MTATIPEQKPTPTKKPLPPSKPDYQERSPSVLPAPKPTWLRKSENSASSSQSRNERYDNGHYNQSTSNDRQNIPPAIHCAFRPRKGRLCVKAST